VPATGGIAHPEGRMGDRRSPIPSPIAQQPPRAAPGRKSRIEPHKPAASLKSGARSSKFPRESCRMRRAVKGVAIGADADHAPPRGVARRRARGDQRGRTGKSARQVPDCSTLCRHQRTVAMRLPYRDSGRPLHLLVDNAGIRAIALQARPRGTTSQDQVTTTKCCRLPVRDIATTTRGRRCLRRRTEDRV
jgi:hypothetical protein